MNDLVKPDMSRTAAERTEHQLSLYLDHIVTLVGDGFREEAKSVIVANEARAANRAAEGIRDAAAKAAEREYVDSPSHGYARERLASSYIARTIRAIPLPEPPPEPRDATIARLSAELVKLTRLLCEPSEAMQRAAFGAVMLGGRSGPITADRIRQESALHTLSKMVDVALDECGLSRAVLAKLAKGA